MDGKVDNPYYREVRILKCLSNLISHIYVYILYLYIYFIYIYNYTLLTSDDFKLYP